MLKVFAKQDDWLARWTKLITLFHMLLILQKSLQDEIKSKKQKKQKRACCFFFCLKKRIVKSFSTNISGSHKNSLAWFFLNHWVSWFQSWSFSHTINLYLQYSPINFQPAEVKHIPHLEPVARKTAQGSCQLHGSCQPMLTWPQLTYTYQIPVSTLRCLSLSSNHHSICFKTHLCPSYVTIVTEISVHSVLI